MLLNKIDRAALLLCLIATASLGGCAEDQSPVGIDNAALAQTVTLHKTNSFSVVIAPDARSFLNTAKIIKLVAGPASLTCVAEFPQPFRVHLLDDNPGQGNETANKILHATEIAFLSSVDVSQFRPGMLFSNGGQSGTCGGNPVITITGPN